MKLNMVLMLILSLTAFVSSVSALESIGYPGIEEGYKFSWELSNGTRLELDVVGIDNHSYEDYFVLTYHIKASGLIERDVYVNISSDEYYLIFFNETFGGILRFLIWNVSLLEENHSEFGISSIDYVSYWFGLEPRVAVKFDFEGKTFLVDYGTGLLINMEDDGNTIVRLLDTNAIPKNALMVSVILVILVSAIAAFLAYRSRRGGNIENRYCCQICR